MVRPRFRVGGVPLAVTFLIAVTVGAAPETQEDLLQAAEAAYRRGIEAYRIFLDRRDGESLEAAGVAFAESLEKYRALRAAGHGGAEIEEQIRTLNSFRYTCLKSAPRSAAGDPRIPSRPPRSPPQERDPPPPPTRDPAEVGPDRAPPAPEGVGEEPADPFSDGGGPPARIFPVAEEYARRRAEGLLWFGDRWYVAEDLREEILAIARRPSLLDPAPARGGGEAPGEPAPGPNRREIVRIWGRELALWIREAAQRDYGAAIAGLDEAHGRVAEAVAERLGITREEAIDLFRIRGDGFSAGVVAPVLDDARRWEMAGRRDRSQYLEWQYARRHLEITESRESECPLCSGSGRKRIRHVLGARVWYTEKPCDQCMTAGRRVRVRYR